MPVSVAEMNFARMLKLRHVSLAAFFMGLFYVGLHQARLQMLDEVVLVDATTISTSDMESKLNWSFQSEFSCK